MEINGEYTFGVSQEWLWNVLRDPKALASIIPLVRNVKQVSDNEYTGTLFYKVGSIGGTFLGKIVLFNMQEPHSYDIQVQGSSSVGEVNMTGGLRLEPKSSGTTIIYQGNILYGGRIASVGSRLLEVSTRTLIQHSFGTLGRYLVNT